MTGRKTLVMEMVRTNIRGKCDTNYENIGRIHAISFGRFIFYILDFGQSVALLDEFDI